MTKFVQDNPYKSSTMTNLELFHDVVTYGPSNMIPYLSIDGDSLVYFIMKAYAKDLKTYAGGELERFGYYVRSFFRVLCQCAERIDVFLDGECENDEERENFKLETLKTRKREKGMELLNNLGMDLERNTLPEGAFSIFGQEANKIMLANPTSFKVMNVDGEADSVVASFARFKKGGVAMSSDGDFYFSGCKVIILADRSLRVSRPTEPPSIRARVFDPVKFCGVLNMKVVHLPLLATLVSNDYVSSKEFMPFYDAINTSKVCLDNIGEILTLVSQYIRLHWHPKVTTLPDYTKISTEIRAFFEKVAQSAVPDSTRLIAGVTADIQQMITTVQTNTTVALLDMATTVISRLQAAVSTLPYYVMRCLSDAFCTVGFDVHYVLIHAEKLTVPSLIQALNHVKHCIAAGAARKDFVDHLEFTFNKCLDVIYTRSEKLCHATKSICVTTRSDDGTNIPYFEADGSLPQVIVEGRRRGKFQQQSFASLHEGISGVTLCSDENALNLLKRPLSTAETYMIHCRNPAYRSVWQRWDALSDTFSTSTTTLGSFLKKADGKLLESLTPFSSIIKGTLSAQELRSMFCKLVQTQEDWIEQFLKHNFDDAGARILPICALKYLVTTCINNKIYLTPEEVFVFATCICFRKEADPNTEPKPVKIFLLPTHENYDRVFQWSTMSDIHRWTTIFNKVSSVHQLFLSPLGDSDFCFVMPDGISCSILLEEIRRNRRFPEGFALKKWVADETLFQLVLDLVMEPFYTVFPQKKWSPVKMWGNSFPWVMGKENTGRSSLVQEFNCSAGMASKPHTFERAVTALTRAELKITIATENLRMQKLPENRMAANNALKNAKSRLDAIKLNICKGCRDARDGWKVKTCQCYLCNRNFSYSIKLQKFHSEKPDMKPPSKCEDCKNVQNAPPIASGWAPPPSLKLVSVVVPVRILSDRERSISAEVFTGGVFRKKASRDDVSQSFFNAPKVDHTWILAKSKLESEEQAKKEQAAVIAVQKKQAEDKAAAKAAAITEQ